MTVLTEGNLQITLPPGATGRKFDEGTSHGLSHCMKAVDFIVEIKEKTYFIELKDPDHPKTKPENKDAFLEKLLSSRPCKIQAQF